MTLQQYPLYLGGKPFAPNHDLEVHHKYSGKPWACVALADGHALDRAIALAAAAARPMAQLRPYERQDMLLRLKGLVEERRDELTETLIAEVGKPRGASATEVTRLIATLQRASEIAVQMGGEVLPLALSERSRSMHGHWQRLPIGACSFVTPFNFPLNLVAHKIAPALAVGCPFVLKPASRTPVSALLIGELLEQLDLPTGAFSVLPCRSADAAPLVEDERLKLLSFTGSPAVGWDMKARAGRKRVTLELGGNAAVLIGADADLEWSVERTVKGGFAGSGQSCISVQRVIVHRDVYQDVRDRLVTAVQALKHGDPADPDTVVGPLIDASEAERLGGWIEAAAQGGAEVLCGGRRHGAVLEPTVVENVPHRTSLYDDEAFGPVICLEAVDCWAEGIHRVNDSRYGLQAGVFTRDLDAAYQAFEGIEVGGVMVNEVPTWREDHMPYGGVKESGFGREGVRFAAEEMTEIRLMAIHRRSAD